MTGDDWNIMLFLHKGGIVIEDSGGNRLKVGISALKGLKKSFGERTASPEKGILYTYKTSGVNFHDLMDYARQKGLSTAGLSDIEVMASDGYTAVIPGRLLNRDILLVYDEDNTPAVSYGEKSGRGMYCVKNIVKLAAVKSKEKQSCKQVILLEGLLRDIESREMVYNHSKDRAISLKQLADERIQNPPEFVTVTARDGLQKLIGFDVFIKGLLKLTGKDAPLFWAGEHLCGMQIKKISHINAGETVFVSIKR